ncbi:endo-1,4-beta-xylanase [Paenibacillus baekrokdamisoli]|uniref:endo-1,4-beta-xylanase n=1 Tax=Paenibacillus baekrokdamisoli TaxID=1712516 RepID=UPI00181ADC7A|nr:endo-1,4-beta-xylanase [Paenibacillus baekrokdamisoli]MBB3067965.1 endo-1,4-beta-xylanase [Paenibacillus baekrokdamisoli]
MNTQADSSLKSFAQLKNKHIGIATQSYYVNDSQYASVLNHEFDIITPEYQMKMGQVQPQKGVFNFDEADKLVSFATKNNLLIRGHALIWHQSLPDWVVNGTFTKEQWINIMKDHITQTVSHFKGKIYAWDVVNEAFWQNGAYRPTVWYDNIGPEYIELAFKFAHDADPNAKLFYNDFDTEVTNDRSNAIYKMVTALKAKGVPIDGIGFQTHLTINGVNYAEMKKNFQRFADLGLDTDITELDIVTHTFSGTQEEKLQAQAEVYSNIFDIALNLPSVKSIVFWGMKDGQSWLNKYTGFAEYPLLFDNSYDKKPAYKAILQKLNT